VIRAELTLPACLELYNAATALSAFNIRDARVQLCLIDAISTPSQPRICGARLELGFDTLIA
jgi:hypothetical protein